MLSHGEFKAGFHWGVAFGHVSCCCVKKIRTNISPRDWCQRHGVENNTALLWASPNRWGRGHRLTGSEWFSGMRMPPVSHRCSLAGGGCRLWYSHLFLLLQEEMRQFEAPEQLCAVSMSPPVTGLQTQWPLNFAGLLPTGGNVQSYCAFLTGCLVRWCFLSLNWCWDIFCFSASTLPSVLETASAHLFFISCCYGDRGLHHWPPPSSSPGQQCNRSSGDIIVCVHVCVRGNFKQIYTSVFCIHKYTHCVSWEMSLMALDMEWGRGYMPFTVTLSLLIFLSWIIF